MSYKDGWAALRLEMPDRVPRTEYSADTYHYALIRRVTGIGIGSDSSAEEKLRASQAFRKAWSFDFAWSTCLSTQLFGETQTRMGHSDYAENGADRDDRISCPFHDPEEVLTFDPFEAFGPIDRRRMRITFEEHYRKNAALFPDEVNMTGAYTTLMSGLIAVFG